MSDYIINVRNISKKEFGNEPLPQKAKAKFLKVSSSAKDLNPDQHITAAQWVKEVRSNATTSHTPDGQDVGDVLIFIHGYNTSTKDALAGHRHLKKGLKNAGYKGELISFDWPSANQALNYLEDREDAKQSAFRLVTEGLKRLVKIQDQKCRINIHVLAHSMGAFVLREAFDDADDRRSIASTSWTISQLCIISGDISSDSMTHNNPKSSSLYRHVVRMTNYYNPHDEVLKLSDVKRIGVKPRLGRIGLPEHAPSKAVNIDCGPYFTTLKRPDDDPFGVFTHTWYTQDKKFLEDLVLTLKGDIDRNRIPTREAQAENRLVLT